MHEAVAKTQRAEELRSGWGPESLAQALAQQQGDFQQSLRCWQRRLQLQAAQTKEEHNVQLKAVSGVFGLDACRSWKPPVGNRVKSSRRSRELLIRLRFGVVTLGRRWLSSEKS